MMKQHVAGWVVGSILLLVAGLQAEMLDGVAAYVDDEVITVGDVNEFTDPFVRNLRQSFQGAELEKRIQTTRQRALNRLIERKLILKAYTKGEAEISEKAIDRRIEDLIHEQFNDDRGALVEEIAKRNKTYDEWRKDIRNEIILASMESREVESKLRITPDEVRKAYEARRAEYRIPERVKVRMILIHAGATPDDNSARRQLAEKTRDRAVGGEDFAELARKVSEDGKAEKGGEWDEMEIDELQPRLRAAVEGLKPGEVSPVVAGENVFYIAKLETRQPVTEKPFEDVRMDIEKRLKEERYNKVHANWIERLKREYQVTVPAASSP